MNKLLPERHWKQSFIPETSQWGRWRERAGMAIYSLSGSWSLVYFSLSLPDAGCLEAQPLGDSQKWEILPVLSVLSQGVVGAGSHWHCSKAYLKPPLCSLWSRETPDWELHLLLELGDLGARPLGRSCKHWGAWCIDKLFPGVCSDLVLSVGRARGRRHGKCPYCFSAFL